MRDGIPVLLEESTLSGLNQQYQGFYNRVAGLYDPAIALAARLAGGPERQFRWDYLRELGVQAGHRVLEVSIGTGANLRYLPAEANYFGLDLSWGMLKHCQRNLAKRRQEAELILGNAEDLPLGDEAFDAVYHVGGINVFSNRARAICEMIRVAKSGAMIVLVDETTKLMESFKWVPSVRRMLDQYRGRFAAPVDLVPDGMADMRVKDVAGGMMYCLVFRKP
jgi:ubiquinone/menaquinone biosynthesis C-methylase UbiE